VIEKLDGDVGDMGDFLGPGAMDQLLLSVVHTCWTTLPPDRRTLDELETEMRRHLDRAFRNMREDEERLKRE